MPFFPRSVPTKIRDAGPLRGATVRAGSSSVGLVFLLSLTLVACDPSEPPSPVTTAAPAPVGSAVPGDATSTAPVHIGSEQCTPCHASQSDAWRGSHHDLAMQPATKETVLADFGDTTFTKDDVTSTFSTRDGQFWVRTDGPDGKLADFRVTHTFGVAPLQQYLVSFPDGRIQALSIAWDTRPKAEGGQRWFHLYPDEPIDSDDPLHWTRASQNWNHMCAQCHSTNLQKNYDSATDKFATTWSEMNVGCEACHGPGSNHVAWAKAGAPATDPLRGLQVKFPAADAGTWVLEPGSAIAKRSTPLPEPRVELETCGPCHARRGQIWPSTRAGEPLADTHRVALLDAGLYHADGQIDGEVFEYGSFLQSRMHAAGVTCTDCHDAHTSKLRAEGNALCARCHAAQTFDVPKHTMHEGTGAPTQCVSCHMPERLYMVVDGRRDHSLRVPRPDLTASIGVPNACNGCHTDKTAEWAASAIAKNSSGTKAVATHYGEAIAAGRSDAASADAKLRDLIGNPSAPAIARGTAMELLVLRPNDPALRAASQDPDPLLRRAAAEALLSLPPNDRIELAVPLLTDKTRSVRLAAIASLLAADGRQIPPSAHASAAAALAEYRESQILNADRAEGQLNLATIATMEGDLAAAERAYRTALEREPASLPAYINFADFLRRTQREEEADRTLREALAIAPRDATLRHALGLSLVRQGKLPEAVPEFAQAYELQPDNARFAFVYAVALEESGQSDKAREVLLKAQKAHPGDTDIHGALQAYKQ